MRRRAIQAIVFTCCSTLTMCAQALTDRIATQFTEAPAKLAIVNNHASPITRLVIVTDLSQNARRAYEEIWFDVGVEYPRDQPIKQGEKREFLIGGGRVTGSNRGPEGPTILQSTIRAAIFADGSSVGDPAWVLKLQVRRLSALEQIAIVETILRRALAQHSDRASIVSSLQKLDAELETSQVQMERKVPARLVIYRASSTVDRSPVDVQKVIPAILQMFSEMRSKLQ